MINKLVSQQAAIDAVNEITTTMSVCTNKDECYGMKRMQEQAITELANLPSAEQTDIIHCKDCKHYSKHRDDYMCGLNVLAYVRENDFCSRAERREDATD